MRHLLNSVDVVNYVPYSYIDVNYKLKYITDKIYVVFVIHKYLLK